MPCTASGFQQVLSLVHEWWLQGFQDALVNGQRALTNEEGHEALLRYVNGYVRLSRVGCYRCCFHPDACFARTETPKRGGVHSHSLILHAQDVEGSGWTGGASCRSG